MDKVIIIGGDHHNGLALARMFSINNVEVECYIISNDKKAFIQKSKYINSAHIFGSENMALDFILDNYKAEMEKVAIFPYSDGAAYAIDMRLDEFKSKFYVPSINGEQGKIARMMDKREQYNFSIENEIKIAKSVLVDMRGETEKISGLQFPLIIKPNISANGMKKDIAVCPNMEEVEKIIAEYRENGYEYAIVQEYIDNNYEMVIVGYISAAYDKIVYSSNKVIRRWPNQGGTNSFSTTVTDENILKECSVLLNKIKKLGFDGLIDVEVFWVNGELYLNEINWRNSGGGFRALAEGYYYAYWYYQEIVKHISIEENIVPKDSYSIVEYTDVRNMLTGRVGLFKWLADIKRCQNFALVFPKDWKPFWYKILYKIMK